MVQVTCNQIMGHTVPCPLFRLMLLWHPRSQPSMEETARRIPPLAAYSHADRLVAFYLLPAYPASAVPLISLDGILDGFERQVVVASKKISDSQSVMNQQSSRLSLFSPSSSFLWKQHLRTHTGKEMIDPKRGEENECQGCAGVAGQDSEFRTHRTTCACCQTQSDDRTSECFARRLTDCTIPARWPQSLQQSGAD